MWSFLIRTLRAFLMLDCSVPGCWKPGLPVYDGQDDDWLGTPRPIMRCRDHMDLGDPR